MIDGLKLTMTGVELRTKLDERIRWHQQEVRRNGELLRNPQCRDKEPGWSEAALETEVARSEKQIDVLTLIRDYIIADEVYRLGEFDLRFADLLPEDDPWECGCFTPFAPGAEDSGLHHVGKEGVAQLARN